MGLIVDLGQVLPVKVSVYLGGGNVGVAKQFLNCTQVARGLEQMAGERMPEHVGMNRLGKVGAFGPGIQPELHAPLGQTATATVEKKCLLIGPVPNDVPPR